MSRHAALLLHAALAASRLVPCLTRAGVPALAALLVAACDDLPNSLLGSGDRNTDPNATAEALQCKDKPAGRSYASFDGSSKLEDSRLNEMSAANLARFKPYAVMAGEYQRVLGVVPKSLAGAASSFDSPPDRWYADPSPSGVSLSTSFDISFEACGAALASGTGHDQAPTADTATDYCTTTMRKAWSRSPSPDEIGVCVDLATQKLGAEPDPRRRWTYVCASILSSSHFLTF
jgi:hypothetical protein